MRMDGRRIASRVARKVPVVRSLIADRDQLRARVKRLERELSAARGELEHARVESEPPREADLFPPGHYYSPIPSIPDVLEEQGRIWRPRASLPGIRLDGDAQLNQLAAIASAQPIPGEPRYRPDNDFFSWGDGVVLRGMLAVHRPRRIIEVGSGWSSALILDTREALADWDPSLVLIEPHPERLHGLLRGDERGSITIHEKRVQDVDLSVMTALQEGDVLFIDSTHVSKVGSDVNLLLLDVLPQLRSGVFVHIHDVFWPFEYPKAWVEEGRYWNEDYLIRAILSENPRWAIEVFNDWLAQERRSEAAALSPDWAKNPGGSLWLRRR